MRLIPRLSSKQKIWPGGPEIGDVVKSQLSPPEAARSGPGVPPVAPAPLDGDPPASEQPDADVALLMVLR
jgi:hypothetical protein